MRCSPSQCGDVCGGYARLRYSLSLRNRSISMVGGKGLHRIGKDDDGSEKGRKESAVVGRLFAGNCGRIESTLSP